MRESEGGKGGSKRSEGRRDEGGEEQGEGVEIDVIRDKILGMREGIRVRKR